VLHGTLEYVVPPMLVYRETLNTSTPMCPESMVCGRTNGRLSPNDSRLTKP